MHQIWHRVVCISTLFNPRSAHKVTIKIALCSGFDPKILPICCVFVKNLFKILLYLPPALLKRSRSRFYTIQEVFQFCSRSVLYLFQNLFKICSRLTRSWSRLAVSAPTVEVWASLVLYSETRRSKVTSLSYFWAFICLDWKPAGCSVGFCAQASLVAHFLSPTAHMIPLGTRRQIVVNMYVGIHGEKLEKREQH